MWVDASLLRQADYSGFIDALYKRKPAPSTGFVLSGRRGDDAAAEIQAWANANIKSIDPTTDVTVAFDSDSNTFVVRLIKASRVLIFRLSESQVHTDGRESECLRTLNRKIKDLANLI